jgi:transcriptional regulator with XRE-family HTH domain
MTAGLTQQQLARRAMVSQQEVSRVERGHQRSTLETRCRLAAACGAELGWRLYPYASVSLRDSGQLGMAQAIVRAAHPRWTPRLEVPVGRVDLRAADIVLESDDEVLQIEVERTIVDFQAQLRAAQLKRESLAAELLRPVGLVIAVPDTRAVRTRLAPYRDLLARSLPISSRSIWAALHGLKAMGGDGILFVRERAITPQVRTTAPTAGTRRRGTRATRELAPQ